MHRNLVAALAVLLLLPACQSNRNTTTLFLSYPEYDIHLERGPEGVLQVAVYRDGRVLGLDGVGPNERQLVDDFRGPAVDHSRIEAWNLALDVGRGIAASGGGAAALMEQVAELPFAKAQRDLVRAYLEANSGSATELLVGAKSFDLGNDLLTVLVDAAIAGGGLDDDRLADLIRNGTFSDTTRLYARLATSSPAGRRTHTALLGVLEDAPGSDRPKIYDASAASLVADPDLAKSLVERMDDLYASERKPATMKLLQMPEASPAFAVAVLDHLDDFYASDRKEVYLAAGQRVVADPDHADLFVKRLDELYTSDRKPTALAVLAWSHTAPDVFAGYLNALDEFYHSDRRPVLEAVIDSDHFAADATLRRRCITAAADLGRDDREAVLTRIAVKTGN